MKQKDIALIIVVVFISAVLSLLVSNKIFAPPKDRKQQVQVVSAITSTFNPPDNKYFNAQSVDPTQLIQIGANNNTNPFNAAH